MDNTLPRFEAFPSYVSCIKNYGRPILPPLLSSAQRQEMAEIRHQAIIAEARISRRSIQKSSLMDKAKEIMEKIEKSQINLLEKSTDCNKGLGDHSFATVDQAPVNPPNPELPSFLQGDNMANVPPSVQQKNNENPSNCSLSVHGTESCPSETEDSCSQCSVYEDTTSQISFSMAESDSYIVIPTTCEKNPILSVGDSFVKSQLNNIETSQFLSFCLPFDSSRGFEPDLSPEGNEWEENGDSSSAQKTSDIDETENASMATVILRCEELPNDTDSDSMITSAAQSTDLEKYFDSPGDCQFSESFEKCSQNDCCVQSISSDIESSATLVNSDAESTPVPCRETSGNGSRCESGSLFASNSAVTQEGTKRTSFQTHMRRSSYTLDKPSPALLQAFSSSPCNTNVLGSGLPPHDSNGHPEKLAPEITVSPLSPFPPETLNGQINGLDDLSFVKNSFPCLSADQWAYRVTRDFCDTSELCDEPSVSNDTCDISAKSCDPATFANNDLYEPEPFSSNAFTIPSSPPKSFSPSKIGTLESAFERSLNEPSCEIGATEVDIDFTPSLIPGKPNVMDEQFLSQIFESLQEFQRKQVERLKEEQRQQWEKLHLKFQEQETILHEQLKSLYVSPPDFASKDVCHVDAAEPLVVNRETPENHADDCSVHSVQNSEVPTVVSASSEHSPVMGDRRSGKGLHDEILDPVMKRKFDRVSATVKGYLTRRLMKTERVQGIIQTIKDTLLCAVRFHQETPVKKGLITEQDADLHQRLISQITAACCELHDIFFKISTKERMSVISQSRELARERKKNDSEDAYPSQKNATFRRSPRSKTRPILSSATIKYLERKNSRSSSEGKNLGLSPKGKSASRAIPKRPASASGRRTMHSPPMSLRSSKCTPYAKTNIPTKSSAKNAKSVRRLIYSRVES